MTSCNLILIMKSLFYLLLCVFAATAAKFPEVPEGRVFMCHPTFAPVCAKNKDGDTRTFHNRSCFNNILYIEPTQGWEIIFNGPCNKMPLPTDETTVEETTYFETTTRHEFCMYMTCSPEMPPVCGIDKNGITQTFEDGCDFWSTYCNAPSLEWRILHDGECDPVSSTTEMNRIE